MNANTANTDAQTTPSTAGGRRKPMAESGKAVFHEWKRFMLMALYLYTAQAADLSYFV
jgi:hypothetical protein